MVIRIVKMVFVPEELPAFLHMFENVRERISGFEGCKHLELWQDHKRPNVVFTCSHWEAEARLEAYRKSDLFKKTWKETRQKFADRPQAWSLVRSWRSN